MKIICRLPRCKLLLLLPLTIALALPLLPQQAPSQGAPAKDHYHIGKAEADELFRSVDQILKFASEQTGLPILHPVKKKLATREEVAKYVAKRLKEQESAERFAREALPLKKLGLLPRDFDLRQYLVDLYKEQVEGWYDTKTKTVYLLDWVSPDEQKPIMAHELVHALQDQSFGLEHWLDVAKDSKDATAQIALDEQRVARQAVVEGQAMAVLAAYERSAAGSARSSQPADEAASANAGEMSVYSDAPLYLREALLFPYIYGVDFIRTILQQRGKQAAFAGVFQHPPSDTRQIMQPSTYLSSEPQPQVKVIDLQRVLGPEWQRVDISGIGEIDLHILLRVWGGDDAAKLLTSAWHGGYYVALSPKNAPQNAPLSLALTLQLDSPEDALRFAELYVLALPKRYSSVQPAASGPALLQPAAADAKPFLGQWMTEQGLVSLYEDGATIVALESFGPTDSAKIHAALAPASENALATSLLY
jgi:hypothetical protein